MNQMPGIDNPRPDNPIQLLLPEETKTRGDIHPPTLSEIQRRACKIHYERDVSAGYTLDDWLKAEHELERRLMPSGKNDQVH
jgi:hypothetical protein